MKNTNLEKTEKNITVNFNEFKEIRYKINLLTNLYNKYNNIVY